MEPAVMWRWSHATTTVLLALPPSILGRLWPHVSFHATITDMTAVAPQNTIFDVNPYEDHPSLSPVEADILWEYAKLNQHIKDVRTTPVLTVSSSLTFGHRVFDCAILLDDINSWWPRHAD